MSEAHSLSRHADKRYRETLINVTALELASGDLGKYYQALDRAIMRFHQIKMDEINKIIKDLWQQTYRGKGISNIDPSNSVVVCFAVFCFF